MGLALMGRRLKIEGVPEGELDLAFMEDLFDGRLENRSRDFEAKQKKQLILALRKIGMPWEMAAAMPPKEAP